MKQRILFCNIAYMKYYNTEFKETPINGGAYVSDTKDALEKYNFQKCEDGFYRGFVETKHRNGYKKGILYNEYNSLRIENIDCSFKKEMSIPNVLVVFCARKDGKTLIVGWYNDAIVYRRRPEYQGRAYNLMTKIENAVLLNEDDRVFVVPRATKKNIGLGQSNTWYANKPEHQEFVQSVIRYINSYN